LLAILVKSIAIKIAIFGGKSRPIAILIAIISGKEQRSIATSIGSVAILLALLVLISTRCIGRYFHVKFEAHH